MHDKVITTVGVLLGATGAAFAWLLVVNRQLKRGHVHGLG